jgi:hypothetical protein
MKGFRVGGCIVDTHYLRHESLSLCAFLYYTL